MIAVEAIAIGLPKDGIPHAFADVFDSIGFFLFRRLVHIVVT